MDMSNPNTTSRSDADYTPSSRPVQASAACAEAVTEPATASSTVSADTPVSPTTHTEEPKGKVSLQGVARLLALALPYKRQLIVAGILMLIATGINLSLPIFTKTAIDRFTQIHEGRLLDQMALGLIGLIVLGSVCSYGEFLLMAYSGNRVVMEMRQNLFAHLQRLPVAFFDRTRSGDLTSHLSNDVTQIQQTLTEDLVRFVGNLITVVCGVSLAVYIDWRLTLVVVLLLLLVMSFFVVNGKKLRKLNRASLDALSEAMGTMTETFANIRLVKAFAREAHEDGRAATRLQKVFEFSMKGSRIEGAFGTVAFAGFILVLLGVVWYGGHNVLNGSLSPGSLVGFLLCITIISGPMGGLAVQYSRLQRAIGATDRLFALLDDAPETPDAPDAVGFPNGAAHVIFNEIDFSYHDDMPVLCGLSLDVPSGKVTALVGPSGSGKTTLAALLYRFYEVRDGQITIDGIDITRIRRTELREHIGLVPQEPVLFNGTLRDNIRYGKLTATDTEVEAAAQAANVAEFVAQFPQGYDTMIGERGVTLSGGQRQRVAIARAVLKNPRILILDEATSALDTRSESLVREALERLMRGRTTLVIAHRLTTIQDADQIAVLERGRIAEIGTHTDLLELGGRYASLQGKPLPELEAVTA